MLTFRMHRAALLALALPGLAHAQTALTPGHPDLVAAPPQSVDYEIRLAGDVPRVVGHFERTETVADGRLTIASHLTMPAQQRDQRDTTVVTWPGLAPVMRSYTDGEESNRVVFAGGRMVGRSVLGNLDEPIDAALPAGAFGEGLSWRLARSVPFRAGYTATFQAADKAGALTPVTLTVGEQQGDAWPVTVTMAGSPATTHLVDAATRQVRTVTYSPRAGTTVEYGAPPPPPTTGVMHPGDPALDTSWLTGDTATYTLQLVQPMQMEVGTSTVTRTVAGGVVTSVQTISVPQQGMNMTQTSRAAAGTLAPVSQSMTGQGTAELAFTPTAVSGTKDGAPVSVALDAPVFDASWSAEVAQSLPFAAGYTAAIAAYDATNGISTIRYTVKGQETVAGVSAWEVEVVSPSGTVTYFIDPATRQMVMMRLSPQEGYTVEMRRQP